MIRSLLSQTNQMIRKIKIEANRGKGADEPEGGARHEAGAQAGAVLSIIL